MSGQFDRREQRPSHTKFFAVNENDIKGATMVESYEKDQAFTNAKELHKSCILYATAYADTMLHRVANEEPTYFEDKGISRPELMSHLINNICYPVTKHYSRQFRETSATMREDKHTQDMIRRMANGGDKFHPYL